MKISEHIYIPTIIFLAVMVVGRLGIHYVSDQEVEKTEIRTQVTAEQVGIRLHDFLNTRITRLDLLRDRMEQDHPVKEADFNRMALLLQNELPGFQAINWINSEGIIQWVTPLTDNYPVLNVDLMKNAAEGAATAFSRARSDKTDTASPLINLVQGGNGFATYLPIMVDDGIKGYINGVFRIEELMTHCFGNTIKDFSYDVALSGQRVYIRGDPNDFKNPLNLGRHNFTILGQSWELQIVSGSKGAETAQVMRGLALVVTFLIASLLAGITYFRMRSNAELAVAYEIIEDSEAKFRTIFDKSPACLVRYSAEAQITDWNLEAASLLGLEFPPLRRRSLYDMEEMKPIIPAIEKTFLGKPETYRGSLEIGGKKIEIDASFEALTGDYDQIKGGIILIKDVTEQNQMLRAKEVMYEIGEFANKIKDLPVLFQTIQKSLSRILDTRNFYVALYSEELDEFTYPYYQDEFDSPPPEPIRGERGISAYVVKNSKPILLKKEEFYTMNKEGKIDLLGTPSEQWLGCPLIVEGKPIGIMAVQSYSTDVVYKQSDMDMLSFVSDQIALTIKINIEDEKLRESEAMHRELSMQLRDSNNIKALLLDILSHDLKNPAGVIAGVAELLSTTTQVSDEIQLIKDSSDVLLSVLNNTTALAKITLGEAITMEDLNLSDMVSDVIDEYKPLFDGEGCELHADIDPGITHSANPIIAEIFRNYLSNAQKYAPEDQPVSVTLKSSEKMIQFCVADLGTTIQEEDRESIFERSIQLENGRKRGSGLGLAIVKRIADVHDARVYVTPNQPQGNIFYLELPIRGEEEGDTHSDVSNSDPKKILVVEDDIASRQYLLLLLKKLDYAAISAETGEQALEIMQAETADMFLLDIALGAGISGLELGAQLRKQERFSEVPMIAVTAFTKDKLDTLEESGFSDYLGKPYNIDQLKEMLEKHIA